VLRRRPRALPIHFLVIEAAVDLRSHRSPCEALLITCAQDMDAMIRRCRGRPDARLLIRIPELSSYDCARWERTLNEALRECGCAAGTRYGFLALLATLAWSGYQAVMGAFAWRVLWHEALMVVLPAIVLGKFIELARARLRIAATMREIKQASTTAHFVGRQAR
jgi:hypothetical protein